MGCPIGTEIQYLKKLNLGKKRIFEQEQSVRVATHQGKVWEI